MVGDSLDKIATADVSGDEAELAAFYQTRLQAMKGFFDSLDNLVAILITLDELRLSALLRFFNNTRK